jgi:hypothetical protein
MKNLTRLSILILTLQCIFLQSLYSQDTSPSKNIAAPKETTSFKVGLSASLQDNQADILVPIWLGSYISISPGFGINWVQDGGTDLRLMLIPRFYFTKKKISPFIGLRLGVLQAIPSVGSNTTDFLAGLTFGGEYFLDSHFSFGIESQANMTISDDKSTRFGNPGKSNLNTATAIFATVYF